MALLVGVVVMLLVFNVLGQHGADRAVPPHIVKHPARSASPAASKYAVPVLNKSFKDVFVAGSGGKPTLGTMRATCWARGGICVEIQSCPSLNIDIGIAGCSWGHKVCCKVQKHLSPTVGIQRRAPAITEPEDLGAALQIIAYRNTELFLKMDEDKELDEREIVELVE